MATKGLEVRYCRLCKEDKELNGFAPSEANGSYGKCKECTKFSKLLLRYKITKDQYLELLKSQNYKCAICPRTKGMRGNMLSVDHDHLTGKIRGLLCDYCNTAIGFLKADESSELLEKATAYIKASKI